jgi:hypothetical protein
MTRLRRRALHNGRYIENLMARIADQSFYVFLLLLPFTYALQVLSGAPEIAVVTYLFLSAAIGVLFLDAFRQQHLAVIRDSLNRFVPLSFAFLFLHHLISVVNAVMTGYAQLGIRGLLLFSLPLLLFWAVQLMRQDKLKAILSLLAIGGIIVCSEMLYESFSLRVLERPSAFQLLNREYVISRIGLDLTQLWGIGYRPPGLLEHVHAATVFAAVAALAHMVLFCMEGRWYWLAGMALCAGALLAHGVRLPVAASMLAFLVLWVVVASNETDASVRRRGLIATVILVCLVLFQLFVDPLGTAKAYYWPALTRGDFQVSGRSTSQMIIEDVNDLAVASEMGKFFLGQGANLSVLLGGHGIVGSLRGDAGFNDDMFLFSLLAQYGAFGFVVFLGLWGSVIYTAITGLTKQRGIDRQARALLYFATGVLLILAIGMLHSSVLQRKAIYPFFPIAAGIAWRFRGCSRDRGFGTQRHLYGEGPNG